MLHLSKRSSTLNLSALQIRDDLSKAGHPENPPNPINPGSDRLDRRRVRGGIARRRARLQRGERSGRGGDAPPVQALLHPEPISAAIRDDLSKAGHPENPPNPINPGSDRLDRRRVRGGIARRRARLQRGERSGRGGDAPPVQALLHPEPISAAIRDDLSKAGHPENPPNPVNPGSDHLDQHRTYVLLFRHGHLPRRPCRSRRTLATSVSFLSHRCPIPSHPCIASVALLSRRWT